MRLNIHQVGHRTCILDDVKSITISDTDVINRIEVRRWQYGIGGDIYLRDTARSYNNGEGLLTIERDTELEEPHPDEDAGPPHSWDDDTGKPREEN